ncbi:MAG TPA: hypothetical protein VGL91_13480 [Acidobacteriota bacterium]
MSTLRCLQSGFRQIGRQKKAITLVWISQLVLAAVVAIPVFVWWSQILNRSLEGDVLLQRFSFQVFQELAQYDRTQVWSLGGTIIACVVGLALLTDTLLVGGILHVLSAQNQESLLHLFFCGAGRFFLRFLRLLIVGALPALLVVVFFNSALRRFFDFVSRDTSSEVLPVLLFLLRYAAVILVILFFKLILDYTRIRSSLQDRRDMLRQLWFSLRFVIGHLVGTFAILCGVGVAGLLLYGIYAVVRTVVPSNNWGLILLMIVLQQSTMILRSGLRVALLASELEYYRSRVVL